ncbi:MAG: hypothetical protein O3C45_03865 [Bacteroidetes bacterium]|nr:hypothetical protein [Bacteroidota bacterium]
MGRSVWQVRPTVLVSLSDAEGRTGWGEAAPLDGYGPDTLAQVVRAVQASDWEAPLPSLQCALGSARAALGALQTGRPFLGTPTSGSTMGPAVLDGTDGVEAARIVKVKVAAESDLSRLQALLRAHPERLLRLDANGAMTRDQALRLLEGLGADIARIDFFEEPFPECFRADHRAAFPVPLAIDESLDGGNWQHADVCVLKPSLMGDPRTTLHRARTMQAEGRRVVVSSAWESRVGMLMLAHLADRLGDAAPGLSTYAWMADDVGGADPLLTGPSVDLRRLPALPAPLVHPSRSSFPVEVLR